MEDNSTLNGIIVKCDREGVVGEVLQDTLGITAEGGQPSAPALVGQPFSALVMGESLKTALSFLEALRAEETTHNWGVFVQQGGRKLFLHIVGYRLNGHYVIIGAASRVTVGQLYHRTLKMHHEQLNALRAELATLQIAQAERESEYHAHVERLNAQVGELQSNLSQREASRLASSVESDAVSPGRMENERLRQELTSSEASRTALAQSEAALGAIFRASPIAAFILATKSGNFVNVSDSFERATGFAHAELAGHPAQDLLTRASQDALNRAIGELSADEPARELTVKFRRRDGELRDGMLALRLIELGTAQAGGAGSGKALLGALHDITEQLSVTQALTADLNAAREQNALLADELRQREYQFKNRLGTWHDPVDVSEIELNLYQQREKEMGRELDSLRRAEQELAAQVTALQGQLARVEAEAAQYKRTLSEHAPTLRAHADVLEQALNGVQATEREHTAAVAQSKQREQALTRQLNALRLQVAELEINGERYKHLLMSQTPVLREQAELLERLAAHAAGESLAPAANPTMRHDSAAPTAGGEQETSQRQLANQSLAKELTAAQHQSQAQQHALESQLKGTRERATLLGVELSRRLQRQQDLAAQISTLKDGEAALRKQIADLNQQLAQRDATIGEYVQREQSLREQLAARRQTEDEKAAQLSTLRGEMVLREVEIARHKANEQSSGAQLSELHHSLRALEMKLKRRSPVGKSMGEVESEIGLRAPAPAANAATAGETGSFVSLAPSPADGSSLDGELQSSAATAQALRYELSAMHHKEQQLLKQIAELDRQVRLLELQVREQTRDLHATATARTSQNAPTLTTRASQSALPAAAGWNEYIALMLETSGESGLLRALLIHFSELMGAPGVCLLLWDEMRQSLAPRETLGLYDRPEARLPLASGDLRSGESELIAGHSMPGMSGTYATLSLPFSARGQPQGVLLVTFDASHQFSSEETARAEQMAKQMALALALAGQREKEQRTLSWSRSQVEHLRQLSTRLAAGEEQGQKRLAQTLQTGVGQNLTMLSIYLDSLSDGLSPESAALVKARLAAYQTLVDEISRSVRDVIAELHPPLLDEDGLPAALRWYSLRFSERTGVPTTVRSDETMAKLEPGVAKTLFRIAQETLTNLEKPNPAYPIRITLSDVENKAQLCISGGEMSGPVSAWDRFRLNEQAEAIGGNVRIESSDGQLARVIVEVVHRGKAEG